MNKKLSELLFGSIALLGAFGQYTVFPSGLKPYSKIPLTKKQRKARLASKRARVARRHNRK